MPGQRRCWQVTSVQAKLDAIGKGQNLILNGLDDMEAVAEHTASGAAGSMFDHWSILQFLNRAKGTGRSCSPFAPFGCLDYTCAHVPRRGAFSPLDRA